MNICLIGDSLTSLALAKSLINKNIKVFVYYKNTKNSSFQSRTIGISKNNFDFFDKEIIKFKKDMFWKIKQIEIYSEKLKDEKILNFENNKEELFLIVKNNEIYELLEKDLKNYLKKERHQTKFIALRYGNVLGSSGSVIPKFIDQIKNKEKLTITDSSMTRFSISMNEALDFILKATEIGKGSEIFVPKLKAYSILDVKDALFELLGETEEQIVGIRPGEKLDEILINKDEMKYTWEYQNMYMVINPSVQQHMPSLLDEFSEKKKIENMDVYSSDLVEKIPKDNLKKIFTDSKLLD